MERFEGPGEERAEGATDALRDRLDETEPVAVVVGAGFRVGLAIGPTVAGGGSDTAASVGTAGVRTSRAAKARANHVPPQPWPRGASRRRQRRRTGGRAP